MLRACRAAASGPDERLNAVEMVIPDGPPVNPAATADLTAWVAYGGADRTTDGWRDLFTAADWTLERVVGLTEPFSLLVCHPTQTIV